MARSSAAKDDIGKPDDAAMDLLLEATQYNASRNPLHRLPIEVQDNILEYVADGPIERARIGCLLDIGSSVTLKGWDKAKHGVGEVGGRALMPRDSVVSYVRFGQDLSGVAFVNNIMMGSLGLRI